jgi:hypothetical protein
MFNIDLHICANQEHNSLVHIHLVSVNSHWTICNVAVINHPAPTHLHLPLGCSLPQHTILLGNFIAMQKFWFRRQYQPLLLVLAITGNRREDLTTAVLLVYVKEDPLLIYTSVLVSLTCILHVLSVVCRTS